MKDSLEDIFDRAMLRMIAARNNGERATTDKAKERTLQEFLNRPTWDVSKERGWYIKQYAERGMAWPGSLLDKSVELNPEIKARMDRILELAKKQEALER